MIYDSWNIRCDRQNFLSSWPIFCPFTPLTTQKIKILKYWKKSPKDINISHMCTINDNHMMYGSWDLERDRQNFLSFWTVFCTFTLKTQKIKTLKKWKNPGDWIILDRCTITDNHMMHGSWDIKTDGEKFRPFTPLTTRKIKILKKWKKHMEISFHTTVPKIMIICYSVPEIPCVTDVIFIFHFGLFFALLPS